MYKEVQFALAAWAAGANVTTWFPENGEHVQTPAAYPQEFEQRLVAFLQGNAAPTVTRMDNLAKSDGSS